MICLLIAKEPKVTLTFRAGKTSLTLNEEGFLCQMTDEEPRLLAWLQAYAQKKPLNTLPLPVPRLPLFTSLVLAEMQQIPFGSTLSYKQLAEAAGNPQASRAVGQACHNNPLPLLIPCHRVLKSDGSLGGFALDLRIKERLLAFEK